MIKAVIVEDELKSKEALEGLLSRYCPNVLITGTAHGCESGIKVINEQEPDVIFLDIQMPDGSGFKLLELLHDIRSEVIFTTAFDQYAIKAIRYSALDYLLKPIIPDELIAAVEKVEEKKKTGQIRKNLNVLIDNLRDEKQENQKIVLSTSEKMHVVEVKDILRCESDNYYTNFFFMDGSRLLISKTLKEIEELLSDHNFIRPHKSHLVNLQHIKSFNRSDGGIIVMNDGSNIPVSRRKREKVTSIISHL